MARCTRLYYDNTMRLQLVKSESGNWFYREYIFNYYIKGFSWTKWKELGKLKNVRRKTTNFENLNGNEITSHKLLFEFEPYYKFYFRLSEKKNIKGLKYRLPY